MLSLAEKYWKWKAKVSKYKSCAIPAMLGFPWMRLYRTNKQVSELLFECIESGIKTKKSDSYHCKVEFNNGYKFNLWIANKMYAYGSGYYTKPNEKYEWCTQGFSGIPSRFVNNVFRKYVEETPDTD